MSEEKIKLERLAKLMEEMEKEGAQKKQQHFIGRLQS